MNEKCGDDADSVDSETKEEYSKGPIIYGAGPVFGDWSAVYVSIKQELTSDTVEE
ncbi:hypothetical protein FWD07_03395 [Candidatus Saccharibacteria bacterium]|nr:hypothetical protein [Candidatus Saccharibacteria bacterium]